MQLRRTALVLGALVLSVAPLSACGGWASERNYTPAVGANNRDGSVDVLGATIVAPADGQGVFIATLVNNSATDAAQLTGLKSPAAGLTFDTPADDGPPIADIQARGLVNLAASGGIGVTGDFAAGQYTEVTLTFGDGESITVDVPVVLPTDEFEGLGS